MAKDIGNGGPVVGGEEPGAPVYGAAPASPSKVGIWVGVGVGVVAVTAAVLFFVLG